MLSRCVVFLLSNSCHSADLLLLLPSRLHAKEDPLLLEIDHGLKPNWIYCTTAGYHLPGPHVFVADTSNVISTYTFRT